MAKNLVAYFTASFGATKKVAETLADAIGADLYEIKPKVPYSNADLNWMDKSSRSTVEMKNWDSRPEMIEDYFSIAEYENIFIGFPIWWYIAPTIINTFLEKHDFSNKKIILFATSGGSGFGKTIENIKPSVSEKAEIILGKVLNNNPTKEDILEWTKSLNL